MTTQRPPFGMLTHVPTSELATFITWLGLIAGFLGLNLMVERGQMIDPPIALTVIVGISVIMLVIVRRNAREDFNFRMGEASKVLTTQDFAEAVGILERSTRIISSRSLRRLSMINLALVKLRMGSSDGALQLLGPIVQRRSWFTPILSRVLGGLAHGFVSTLRGDFEDSKRSLEDNERLTTGVFTRFQSRPLLAYHLLVKAFHQARFGEEQAAHEGLKENWAGLMYELDPFCKEEARLLLDFLCARLEVDHGEPGIGPAPKASYFSVMTSSWPELSAFVEESSKSHQTTTT